MQWFIAIKSLLVGHKISLSKKKAVLGVILCIMQPYRRVTFVRKPKKRFLMSVHQFTPPVQSSDCKRPIQLLSSHSSWCYRSWRLYPQCNGNYSLSLSPAIDCGALTNPDNGRVDTPQGTTFNQVATYSCNSGYELVGNITRACQADGMWSGSEPICGKFITMVVVWEHTNVQCIERLFCSSLV